MTVRIFTRRTLLAGAAGLLALSRVSAARADALDNFSLTDGKPPVPDIQFTTYAGELQKLSDYRGKILLLNAWATWCGPCINEMPDLNKVQEKLGGRDFQVLPVSMDRNGPATVDLFYREHNLKHLPILMDYRSQIATKLRPAGLPFTLLIDHDGTELGRALGEVFWSRAEGIELLKKFIDA